ncbi:MAG: hypothetical protein HY046_05230 [Acidobacteria bacterium]|nr:hypothetical protein [Acidobacteriota bacterium]
MQQRKRNAESSKPKVDKQPAAIKKARKTYRSPVLEQYGDLDALTLSVGSGSGDGMGGASSKNTPCWIAEVLYGVNDPRTRMLRTWLTRVYCRTTKGAAIVALYRACGERVARWARRSALLRRMLTPLFDAGVAAALRHYALAAR